MTSWTTGLLDDATVLTGRALPPALRAHQELRQGPDGDLLGALVVTEQELTHLRTGELPVHLAVTGGAGALEAALRWVVARPDQVTLRRVSVRLRGEETPARNAQRVVTVLDSVDLPGDVEAYAAPAPGPVSPAWLAALDELAAREVGLLLDCDRLETSGTISGTDPVVDAALDRELAMVFRGGASSGADDVTAAMSVVRHALDGEPPPDGWLAGEDGDPDLAGRTRRWCRGVLVPDPAAVVARLRA